MINSNLYGKRPSRSHSGRIGIIDNDTLAQAALVKRGNKEIHNTEYENANYGTDTSIPEGFSVLSRHLLLSSGIPRRTANDVDNARFSNYRPSILHGHSSDALQLRFPISLPPFFPITQALVRADAESLIALLNDRVDLTGAQVFLRRGFR